MSDSSAMMTGRLFVLIQLGKKGVLLAAYGPFETREDAVRFAADNSRPFEHYSVLRMKRDARDKA